jgi:hypothetical protein
MNLSLASCAHRSHAVVGRNHPIRVGSGAEPFTSNRPIEWGELEQMLCQADSSLEPPASRGLEGVDLSVIFLEWSEHTVEDHGRFVWSSPRVVGRGEACERSVREITGIAKRMAVGCECPGTTEGSRSRLTPQTHLTRVFPPSCKHLFPGNLLTSHGHWGNPSPTQGELQTVRLLTRKTIKPMLEQFKVFSQCSPTRCHRGSKLA